MNTKNTMLCGPDLPAPKPGQVFSVGDLHSDDIGTGARMSGDKLAVEVIPVRHWASIFETSLVNAGEYEWEDKVIITCLRSLAKFQEGKLTGEKLLAPVPHPWFDLAVDAFVYGYTGGGYKKWNWIKGMPWSVPLACAIRHAKAHVLNGEMNDKDSGLPHISHFVCNLVMLATFYDAYPEGNDFPDSKYFEVTR